MEPLPPHDQRHLWLRYQDLAERMRMVYTGDDEQEVFVSHAWRRLFGIRAHLVQEFIIEFFSTCRIGEEMGLDVAGLHTAKEMAEDGFGAYWLGSERLIPDKGDLCDYWVKISSSRDFLRGDRHLKRHAEGRKIRSRLLGGHFIRRLAHHFSLLGDNWAWVAPGPKRQQDAAVSALEAAEDAPAIDEGAQAVPAPMQASQPPPPPPVAGRTIP
ncbi:hypothetical protein Tco_0771536, partial [Tanacetum coccineum]